MTRLARLIAAPLVSVGIIGATLSVATPANASITVHKDGGMVAAPDIHAGQMMMYPRSGVYWPVHAASPQVDTTVHQSR